MEENKLSLNELAISALRTSAGWSLFLSIVGFIFTGLMLLLGLLAFVAMRSMPSQEMIGLSGGAPNVAAALVVADMMRTYMPLMYIIIALINIMPIYYLFSYAQGAKRALGSGNNDDLAKALVNLKSHHKFIGIMTIVMISLWIIGFIGIIVFAATMAGSMH